MTLETFFEQFELLADAPNGVQKLRELILQLAFQGKLVPQNPNDESASFLLQKLRKEKQEALKSETIKQTDPLPIPKSDDLHTLPKTWLWVRLGDVALILMGNSPPGSTYNTEGEGVPLINGPVEFGSGPFSETVINQYTTAPTKICKKGDLLLCVRGSTTGRTNIAGFNACIGRGVAAIRAFTYQRYLNYFVLASRQEIYKTGTGSTFPSVSFDRINNFLFPLAPFKEQERIVDKVDRLMELCDRLEEQQKKQRESCIRLNEGAIAQLLSASNAEESDRHWQRICNNFDLFYSLPENISKLRKAIIQSASLGKLIQQSASDEPASSLLKKIKLEKEQLAKDKRVRKEEIFAPVDSEELTTNLPSGWAGVRLGEVINCLDYLRKPINKEERQVRQGDIPYYGANGQVGWIDDFLFNEDLVLVVEDETFIGRQLPFCYRITGKSWVNNHAHVLQPTSGINVDFLNYSLSYYPFDTLTSGTTGRKKLTKSTLLNIPYMLPPLEEQKRIVARVNGLLKLCDELEAKLKDSYSHQEKLMEVAAVQLMQATAKTPVFC